MFGLFSLALIVHAQLQENISGAEIPLIRSCFGIGSHCSYRQAGAPGEAGAEYIVGDVTIQLARLIEKNQHNQILFADFDRMPDGAETVMNTQAFLDRAAMEVDNLRGIAPMSGVIDQVNVYLTGPRAGGEAFAIRKFSVLDKHSIRHDAYNAKINSTFKEGDPVHLGLQDHELILDEYFSEAG